MRADGKGTVEKEGKKIKMRPPVPFHRAGTRWKYQDGTIMVIGPDGAARRERPKVKGSKKAKRRGRRGNNC